MVVPILMGGLGNQMFQYAMGYALARRYKKKIAMYDGLLGAFDTARHYELGVFDIVCDKMYHQIDRYVLSNSRTSRYKRFWLKHAGLVDVMSEEGFRYRQVSSHLSRKVYLHGYWQSYLYFEEYADELRTIFSSRKPLTDISTTIVQQIAQYSNTVSLHIRRGDYLTKAAIDLHGVMPLSYYQRAIDLLAEKYGSLTIFVFSDDIVWAKEHLCTSHQIIWCEGNEGTDSYQDMLLMSKCEHHIIANSSFSWWGAWLNPSEKKTVIAPRQWFADTLVNAQTVDLTPPTWLRISID